MVMLNVYILVSAVFLMQMHLLLWLVKKVFSKSTVMPVQAHLILLWLNSMKLSVCIVTLCLFTTARVVKTQKTAGTTGA